MVDAVKEAVDTVQRAFIEFKEANDQRLAKLATAQAVSDLVAKMANTEKVLDRFEDFSQKQAAEERARVAMQEQLDKIQALLQRPGVGKPDDNDENAKLGESFNHLVRTREKFQDPEHFNRLREYTASLVKGDDTAAGYLMVPPQVETEIKRLIIDISPIRQLANVITIGGHSYKWVKETGSPTAMRVGEIETRVEGADPKFGMGEMQAPEMFSKNLISQQMLEDSAYDLPAELRRGISKQMARKEGIESVSGTGFNAQQMEGMLVASGVGEVVSGDANLIKADGLIDLQYSLHSVYAANAKFALNRKTLRDIRKLKDGQGNYLWVPGFANAVVNTILGAPYVEFPDLPDIGAGNYPVLWGDFKEAYTIVDRVGLGFMVDFVTRADNGLVVYRGRKRVGGGVKEPNALKKLKIAAS